MGLRKDWKGQASGAQQAKPKCMPRVPAVLAEQQVPLGDRESERLERAFIPLLPSQTQDPRSNKLLYTSVPYYKYTLYTK